MDKISYRAILHGPMIWKTSHQRLDSLNNTPYLVIFEPISSLVVVSQGTLLLPQIHVYLNKLNSQILSVFVFNDPSLAKQLFSELNKYLDKNVNIFEVYKNENIINILAKSLSSFHLPLEVVVKKVDYNNTIKHSSKQLKNVSFPRFKNGFNKSSTLFNPYDKLKSVVTGDNTSSYNLKIRNNVPNHILNDDFDYENKFYNDEPMTVKNSHESDDSYNLRVGLDEGFFMITSSTDLMKKLFHSIEKRGPRVNRFSLSFYKIKRPGLRDDYTISTNTLSLSNYGLSLANPAFHRNNTTITCKNNLRGNLYSNADFHSDVKNLNQQVDYKLSNKSGYYTPGFATTPIVTSYNYLRNNTNTVSKQNTEETNKLTLPNANQPLKLAIDKNCDALNPNASQIFNNNHSCSSQTDELNVHKVGLNYNSHGTNKPLNHGLVSMSTAEFFGHSPPAANSNPNNLNIRNYSLVSDTSPYINASKLNSNEFTDITLDDIHVKSFNDDDNYSFRKPNKNADDDHVHNNDLSTDRSNYDNFVKNYIQVLDKLNEVENLFDLEGIKKKYHEQNAMNKLNESNVKDLNKNKSTENLNKEDNKPNVNLSARTDDKYAGSSAHSDGLSQLSDEDAIEFNNCDHSNVHSIHNNKHESSTFNNEKNTTFRDEDEYKSDIDSNFDKLSTKSDLNVLIDEFNELSTKNELLSKDNSKYRNKISRLKDKIKNIKSLHMYELEDVMNTNYSNEEKLRSTINDNNVTIKMMEQERLKLTEMVEQNKMIIKRLNREKLETVQQLSSLEDEYNKLQMVREMDKNEKYAFSKTKLEVEQLVADNELLNNKLRVANEKILKLQHSENLKNDKLAQLKEKLERIEEDRVKNEQLTNENRLLKTKELNLKDKFDLIKKEQLTLRNDFNIEKSNNAKLTHLNQDLNDELKRVKSALHEYENKDFKLESKLSLLENNNTVLLNNLESSKLELDKLKIMLDGANKEKTMFETKYNQLQDSVEKVESMNNTVSTELKELKRSLESKNNENTRLVALLSEKEKEIAHWKDQTNTYKENHSQLLRQHSYLKESYETVDSSYKKFQKYEQGLRNQVQLKSEQNDQLLRQLQEFKLCMNQFKDDTDLNTARHKEAYSKLVARFLLLAFRYKKLQRENSINKLKLMMMEHKNNTVLTRNLIRSVLLSKAKIAKRNCQILKIIGALNMSGPTTCSMIISRINTLVTATSQNNSMSQDKIAQLKSSFMKHSFEKDQMIKVLQTKLISMDQLKENQQFLLQENRNLSDQIMAEQNNSQKLQQALNEQLERERFAFESESKSLYNRQYQLLKENEQLCKENYSLKESINTLLQSKKHVDESEYVSDHDRNNIFNVKYEKVKNIYKSLESQDLNNSRHNTYYHTPTTYNFKSDFDDNLSMKNTNHYPRMVYHRV